MVMLVVINVINWLVAIIFEKQEKIKQEGKIVHDNALLLLFIDENIFSSIIPIDKIRIESIFSFHFDLPLSFRFLLLPNMLIRL